MVDDGRDKLVIVVRKHDIDDYFAVTVRSYDRGGAMLSEATYYPDDVTIHDFRLVGGTT